MRSPGLTETVWDASLPVVADDPEIVIVKSVALPFLYTVYVQLAPLPGARSNKIFMFCNTPLAVQIIDWA